MSAYFEPDAFSKFYAYYGDKAAKTIDVFQVVATIYRDDDADAPWEREDGHGEVSEWTTRDKSPGERVLMSDGRHHRYYDFQGACKIALHDGWGCEGGPLPNETRKAYAARAAERDFSVLKAWCNDEWTYCGVAVTVSKNGIDLTGKYSNAIWGVELNYPDSDNAHLSEVANELVDEALQEAKDSLKGLCAGTTKLYQVGQRVELHPATDAWMRGDRYGVITKVTAKYYHVQMDKSGRVLRVPERNINQAI